MAQLLWKPKSLAAARGTGQASILIQISSIVNSRSSLTIKKEHLVIPRIGYSRNSYGLAQGNVQQVIQN